MDEKTVAVELSVADWNSVLSVFETAMKSEKMDMKDTEILETLTLLYEDIVQQLAEDGISFKADDM